MWQATASDVQSAEQWLPIIRNRNEMTCRGLGQPGYFEQCICGHASFYRSDTIYLRDPHRHPLRRSLERRKYHRESGGREVAVARALHRVERAAHSYHLSLIHI